MRPREAPFTRKPVMYAKGADISWGGQKPSFIAHLESFFERNFDRKKANILVRKLLSSTPGGDEGEHLGYHISD